MALRSFLLMPLVVLLQNYLRNRLLYFNNRGTTLIAKQDRSVPQGSVPGLRLWNICVDRLSDLALHCSLLLLYADDIFLLYYFQKRQQPTLTIDRDIVAINIILERLGLCCNVNKSNLLSFGLVNPLDHVKTSLKDTPIFRSLIILGFKLHMHLDAKYHV